MMRLPPYIFLLISLVLLLGCKAEEKHTSRAKDLPTVEVTTTTVTSQEGHLQTEVVGTIRAVKKAAIAAKITGSIDEMPVVLGSTVKAGEELVKISAEEIFARMTQAKTQLDQARRNLEREQKLLKKNAATSENVKSLEDMYLVAEAAHQEALTMLSYTTIKAPFDGVITQKMANVGDLATPGIPLIQLEDSKTLQVETSVPESLVLLMQPGDTVGVLVPAAGLELQGTVAEIAPAADPLSRTATVKVNIASEAKLRSGQFARVVIPGDRKKSLFVPTSAISSFGQIEKMFVVSSGKAQLRLVRTGIVLKDRTEVLAGIESGEVIVVSNSTSLIDGQPVKAVQ